MTGVLASLLEGDDADAIVHAGPRVATRGELRTSANALAAALRAEFPRARLVGVLLPNTPDAVASWFGVWQVDAAFVPLNPRNPAAELRRPIEANGVGVVVTVPELAHLVDARRTVDVAGTSLVLCDTGVAPRRDATPDEAIIQFTSGTTGAPKAVVLRHGQVVELLDSVIATLRAGRTSEQARMPNLVPMSLALWGGIYQVLFALRLGVPMVLMERFEPREFHRLVVEYGIRSSVLPPAALVMLMEEPSIESLAPLRYVRSVSAPLSPAHARRFHERFGIAVLNGYGQTELGGEAVGWSAADWKEHGLEKVGSVGRPHAAFEVRVRADDGSPAAAGEVGELEIRSTVAPAPDDAALEGRVTDDGWLRTGDLGRVDADGFVWIDGRVSAMINRGGLKVFPDEVEECLRGADGVHDAAVVGVPDDRLGEVPWAFVVPAFGAELDVDAVRKWCGETMAPYKVPAGFTVVADLPRNEMGKVLRQELHRE